MAIDLILVRFSNFEIYILDRMKISYESISRERDWFAVLIREKMCVCVCVCVCG